MDDTPILIVDDEADARMLLAQILEDEYDNVETAESVAEALIKLETFFPKVILSDVRMPGEDGLSFLKKVRAIREDKDVNVILLTGHGDQDTVVEGLRRGAVDFLSKPCEEDALLEAVRRAVNISKKFKERKEAEASDHAHISKLSTVGELAVGIIHEVNSPVAFVMGNINAMKNYLAQFAQLLSAYDKVVVAEAVEDVNSAKESLIEVKKKLKVDFMMEDMNDIVVESIDGLERIRDIVASLKSYAHSDNEKIAPIDINKTIEQSIKIIWNELKYKCTLNKELTDIPLVNCNAGQLSQVFMNLMVNASHAIDEQGILTVGTKHVDDTVVISIQDNGSGIPQELIDKLFEPFFTTKPEGVGTGLGLSISKEIVEKYGGTIRIESEVDVGTTFIVTMPAEAS
jgi:signal transduction histidine kinase